MADNNYLGAELQQLDNRDRVLWYIVLVLLTVFAVGLRVSQGSLEVSGG